jgi:hypothetical protein
VIQDLASSAAAISLMTLGLQHNPLMTTLYTPMSLALQAHWKTHNNAYRSSAQVPPPDSVRAYQGDPGARS